MLKKIIILNINLWLSVILLAQAPFVLTLEVNRSSRVTIYRNEPLLVTLSISNPRAFLEAQWSREAGYWLKNLEDSFRAAVITKEKYAEARKAIEQEMKKAPFPVLGTAEKPWYELVQLQWQFLMNNKPVTVNTQRITISNQQAAIVLDENAYCLLQWAVFPGSVSQLKAGKYTIVAEINNTFSAPVEILIKPADIPAVTLQTEAVQLKLGRFYLVAKDKKRALMHTKTLLKINPASVDGWVLMGEVLLVEEAYAAALQHFEKALALYKKQQPNTKEPPDYLLSTIQWLKEKIAQQKTKVPG